MLSLIMRLTGIVTTLTITIIIILITIIVASFHRYQQRPHQCCIRLSQIVYIKDVFKPHTFDRLQEACKMLHPALKNENGFAIGRRHVQVSPGTYIHDLFYGKNVMTRLGALIGTRCLRSSRQPIEYRLYTINSSMPWHRDVMISESCPQIEVVYTVYNTSNSTTEWLDERKNQLKRVKSHPNSMLVTQGLGAFHQVTPLTIGERAIIKIAYDLSP